MLGKYIVAFRRVLVPDRNYGVFDVVDVGFMHFQCLQLVSGSLVFRSATALICYSLFLQPEIHL